MFSMVDFSKTKLYLNYYTLVYIVSSKIFMTITITITTSIILISKQRNTALDKMTLFKTVAIGERD